MKKKSTGPALGGVEERWADYDQADLYAWIRNSQALVKTGHPRANELFSEWAKSVMTPFPELSDEDIASILLHVEDRFTAAPIGAAVAATGVGAAQQADNSWLVWLAFGAMAILALILARVISNLKHLSNLKEGIPSTRKTLWESIASTGVIGFAIFGLVVIGGYYTVNNATNLGRQQGYAPDQPIKFSHATHAGLHKIDCQYCHDGARRSKHAVIPAANTCMNCHSAIQSGSQYGTAEITKIYASVGYDPSDGAGAYIDDYDSKTPEELEAIYKKWITNTYLEEKGLTELDKEGERVVESQWNDIVSSLTNEQKKSVKGGIEWVRVHNLPDHVYFNHAQHVTVGGLECQECHGKVEEMEVLGQHAPLSMGWCINCHRETEVQFADNDYYDSYKKYHDEMASGTREKVTVQDIGGLECQKCHY